MPTTPRTDPLAEAIRPIVKHEVEAALKRLQAEAPPVPAPVREPVPAGATLLTIDDLAKRLQQCRSTIWKSVADGIFPRPIKFGRSSRWRLDEIDAFIERQAAQRDTA